MYPVVSRTAAGGDQVIDQVADQASVQEHEQPAVTLADAARRLGVTEKTIRRRIKRGELAAVRVMRPQGHEWRVKLPAVQVADQVDAAGVPRDLDEDLDREGCVATADQVRPGAAVQLAQMLAEQLAAERERSAALERERFELAGRLGYFQAELEHARETIKALQAPASRPSEPAAPAIPAPEEPARPWWRFW